MIDLDSSSYEEFIAAKRPRDGMHGIDVPRSDLNSNLFEYQRDVVRWGLLKGRCAWFTDTGTGKTLMQLEWASQVHRHTGGNVLVLCPLAVAQQTVREAVKFAIETPVNYQSAQIHVVEGITVTNYDKLHLFDPSKFVAVVLDESSILKSFDSKTRERLIESFQDTPYRLACTATPAPNDHMELGNHAEFLGVMSATQMLAMYFVHDGGETSKWRLKGHSNDVFWHWVASWSVMIQSPADLGYDASSHILPPLNIHETILELTQDEVFDAGALFAVATRTLTGQRTAKRASLKDRVAACAEMVNASTEQWLIWCELNDESTALKKAIPGSVEVTGSDSEIAKEVRLFGFIDGEHRVLITKSKIAGFGLNLQNCHKMAFVGVTHSYESWYQSIRRCWRYGQKSPVDVHLFASESEYAIIKNLQRKQEDARIMSKEMTQFAREIREEDHAATSADTATYRRDVAQGDDWTFHLGDSVEVLREMPSESIHYSIFSPPFADLYVYSNSERDMGNCAGDEEFAVHLGYMVAELYRVTMPGRLLSFHCMNLPLSKFRDGVIGLRDFRGGLIRLFQEHGWVYHSEVTIWKDPVTAMQRTKALGLLHKQIKKDSAMSRQGVPDYLVTMRKPGSNPEPVAHPQGFTEFVGEDPPMNTESLIDGMTSQGYSIEVWQRYASPVWMDIDPSDTLQYRAARDGNDERHICPLQLGVIRRAVHLWTNEGDTVLSPFGGIGSEGFVAVEMKRKAILCELKESYWKQGVKNLRFAEEKKLQTSMVEE